MTLAFLITAPIVVYCMSVGITFHVLRRRAGTWSVNRNGQPEFSPARYGDDFELWVGAALWPFVLPGIAGLALATWLFHRPPPAIRDEVDRRRLAELERELELGA